MKSIFSRADQANRSERVLIWANPGLFLNLLFQSFLQSLVQLTLLTNNGAFLRLVDLAGLLFRAYLNNERESRVAFNH